MDSRPFCQERPKDDGPGPFVGPGKKRADVAAMFLEHGGVGTNFGPRLRPLLD